MSKPTVHNKATHSSKCETRFRDGKVNWQKGLKLAKYSYAFLHIFYNIYIFSNIQTSTCLLSSLPVTWFLTKFIQNAPFVRICKNQTPLVYQNGRLLTEEWSKLQDVSWMYTASGCWFVDKLHKCCHKCCTYLTTVTLRKYVLDLCILLKVT